MASNLEPDQQPTSEMSRERSTPASKSDGLRTAIEKLNAAEGLTQAQSERPKPRPARALGTSQGAGSILKPKRKQGLAGLGGLLIFGGIMVLRQAGRMQAFYQSIREDGSVSWAPPLAWLMILAGGGLLLAGLARKFDSSD